LIQGTFAPTGGVTYTVTIGAGGVGENAGGTSSIVGIVNASGGGHGIDDDFGRGGNNGVYTGGSNVAAGGGGGAGAGGNGVAGTVNYGGVGGSGVAIPLHPTGLTAGGGGGGGGRYLNASGGSGGGGQGNNGAANTGSGGGGNRNNPRSGGSGRVILRYSDASPAATAITGSPTITVSGGYRHYDFTSSGSITF